MRRYVVLVAGMLVVAACAGGDDPGDSSTPAPTLAPAAPVVSSSPGASDPQPDTGAEPDDGQSAGASDNPAADFEVARYEGFFSVGRSGAGEQFGGLGEEGRSDEPDDEIWIDTVGFVAGATLNGTAELLANVNFIGDLSCVYRLYEFRDVQLVDNGTQTYAGRGTEFFALEDDRCVGAAVPATEFFPVDIRAEVIGDVMTITISSEGDNGDEPLVLTATRIDS